jgi:MATE family multidrug resistance protein
VFLIPVFLLAIPLAPSFFALVGHPPSIRAHEVTYFQILCIGSGPTIVSAALSTFFTGRGQTWVTMCVSGIAALVNIVADYLLIFDILGLGVPGIAGAAWATVLAHLTTVAVYLGWMYLPKYRTRYNLDSAWRLNRALMQRLVYFGGTSGAQMLIEGVGFTLLLLLIGRIGQTESAATTLAFNVNIVAFIPMVGLAIAVSVLVGQHLGNNRPDLARRATWSGLSLGLIYSSFFAFLYFAVPQLFFLAHDLKADSPEFLAARAMATVLLKFVALYFIFDTIQLVFSFAIKGAGDTLFVLFVAAVTSAAGVILGQAGANTLGPLVGGSIYWWWYVMTGWILALAVAYFLRFESGVWQRMRVIEKQYLRDGPPPLGDLPSDTNVYEVPEEVG